ncbi:hypothetical protein WJX84_010770 [Apatococcus fuscideae]|uniref:HAUS augmin-like complex subunit 6 N-terminal domain-containing protein n=1 Tax=Apatococcus fuscideae TaxID=2026836 RepID=A0AAW1TEZ9_9CHLO
MEAKREDGSGTLLFSNLLLLGLEPGRVKKEQGLELADNMFRSTNVSCLDFVLHFLYCRLQRTELVRKDLKGLWPCKDVQQQKAFEKVIREFLLDLAQQKAIPRRLANAAQSLFKNAAGTRLTELLSMMSSLALQQHHARLFPQDAAKLDWLSSEEQLLGPALSCQLEMVADAQVAAQLKLLKTHLQSFAAAQEGWDGTAAELSSRFTAARKHLQPQADAGHQAPEAAIKSVSDSAGQQLSAAQASNTVGGSDAPGYSSSHDHPGNDVLASGSGSTATARPATSRLLLQEELKFKQLHGLTASIQEHLASHTHLHGLAQQALLSSHHPSQIDGGSQEHEARGRDAEVPSVSKLKGAVARGNTADASAPASPQTEPAHGLASSLEHHVLAAQPTSVGPAHSQDMAAASENGQAAGEQLTVDQLSSSRTRQQSVDLIELIQGASQRAQELAGQMQQLAGLAPDSSLVGMAVPAGMGGVQQAQLQLMLSQQQQRLVQLQALQASLLAELEAAGTMRATFLEQVGRFPFAGGLPNEPPRPSLPGPTAIKASIQRAAELSARWL